MLHVHAAVLATFLLGIAVGARFAGKARRHLWLMEILVGASAVAVSGALEAIDTSGALKLLGSSAPLTVLVCMALVALPAVLVGMSVPLFSDYLSRAVGEGAFRRTYALYNLGAVASVLAVEFLLVRTLGHQSSLYAIAAGNVAVGVLLFTLFPEARVGVTDPRSHRLESRRLVWGLGALGAASSLFQMCFVRASVDVLGPNREVFALTLALVLLGFPLGTLLARRLSLRATMRIAAASICLVFLAFPHAGGAWWPLAAAGLLPFVCFGAVLPIVLDRHGDDGDIVGHAMWASGLGNAAGYLLYVLVVSPALPLLGQLMVVLGMLCAGIALTVGPRTIGLTLAGAWAAALVLLMPAVPPDPPPTRQPNAALLGVLPALYADHTRSACVLGAGSGVTAGAAARIFDRVDVIEIDGATIERLPTLAAHNFGLATNPRARLVHDDARVFLLGAGPYDVVLNATGATATKLHTTEFFRRVRAALAPGGVYATRVSPTMPETSLRAVVGSLRRVFDACAATRGAGGDLLLACGDTIRAPRSLASLDLPRALAFLRHADRIHLKGDFLRRVDPQGLENTDDLPISEFASR